MYNFESKVITTFLFFHSVIFLKRKGEGRQNTASTAGLSIQIAATIF